MAHKNWQQRSQTWGNEWLCKVQERYDRRSGRLIKLPVLVEEPMECTDVHGTRSLQGRAGAANVDFDVGHLVPFPCARVEPEDSQHRSFARRQNMSIQSVLVASSA